MVRWILALAVTCLLATASYADSDRYWIFFRDKGIVPGLEQRALDDAMNLISERSIARRLKNGAPVSSYGDVPINSVYADHVRQTGAIVRSESKWLNAVSIAATPAQLEAIQSLPFVCNIRRFSQRLALDQPDRVQSASLDSTEYGNSFRQNQICRIPELHARGLSGNGVLLCMLDTGFFTEHVSLSGLSYLAMRDFIFGDSIVHNEPGQDSSGQHLHGTAVLSAAGGLDSNNIIGPAYGATWMLAKTEYTPTETEVEEDYYVAGLEWADSAGADITTSSLGYIDWYTQSQMDGRTTVVARAVVEAQRRGILVVTAQGNEGLSEWGTVISPADADSILAVGGVDSLSLLWPSSSPGPTADGRIKPDCAAQAAATWCAAVFGDDTYWRLSGTSLATPIIAGVAALVMEANPDWTAQQVREAIMATASQSNSPDNILGYGIADAVAAADYQFSAVSTREVIPSTLSLTAYPNPVNGQVSITLDIERAQSGKLILFDLLGRKIATLQKHEFSVGTTTLSHNLDGFASGKYFLSFIGSTESKTIPIILLK